MPVDAITVLLASPLEQIARYPSFITRLFGAFGKYLKFPLSCSNFSIDAFHIDARF